MITGFVSLYPQCVGLEKIFAFEINEMNALNEDTEK